MKTVVLGSGGWGTALSQILCDNGHETYLWSHSPAKAAERRPGGQRTALLRRAGDSKKNGPVSHGEDCGGVRFQGD